MLKIQNSNKTFILVLSTLIGGILASLFTLIFIPNQYNATAEFKVHTEEAVDPNIYEAIIKSDKVVQKLKEQENITTPVKTLKRKIKVDFNEEKKTLKVSLSLDNRRHSVLATDGLAKIATEEIESFVQGSTVEYVKAPNDTVIEDTSLKVKLVYIIIGLLAGLGIGAAIYALKEPKKKGQQTKVDTDHTLLGSIPKY